jgi:hypothetical protein
MNEGSEVLLDRLLKKLNTLDSIEKKIPGRDDFERMIAEFANIIKNTDPRPKIPAEKTPDKKTNKSEPAPSKTSTSGNKLTQGQLPFMKELLAKLDKDEKKKGEPREVTKEATPVFIQEFSKTALKQLHGTTSGKDKTKVGGPGVPGVSKDVEKKAGGLFKGGLLAGLKKIGIVAGILALINEFGNINLKEWSGLGGMMEAIGDQLWRARGIFKMLVKTTGKKMLKIGAGFLGGLGKLVGVLFSKKLGLKLGGAALKVSAKGIPIIGGLVSFGFAVHAFAKGQIVTGVIDLVSGIINLLGLIPGAALITTPISTGLDVFNAFLDLKFGGGEAGNKAKSNFGPIPMAKKVGMWLYKIVRHIPIVGSILRAGEGVKAIWDGDVARGTVKFAGSILQMVGMGWAADMFEGMIDEKTEEREKTTGKKISFGRAVKDFFMDKVRSAVKVLPNWVRFILKKTPGFRRFIESVENEKDEPMDREFEKEAKAELAKKKKPAPVPQPTVSAPKVAPAPVPQPTVSAPKVAPIPAPSVAVEATASVTPDPLPPRSYDIANEINERAARTREAQMEQRVSFSRLQTAQNLEQKRKMEDTLPRGQTSGILTRDPKIEQQRPEQGDRQIELLTDINNNISNLEQALQKKEPGNNTVVNNNATNAIIPARQKTISIGEFRAQAYE